MLGGAGQVGIDSQIVDDDWWSRKDVLCDKPQYYTMYQVSYICVYPDTKGDVDRNLPCSRDLILGRLCTQH